MIPYQADPSLHPAEPAPPQLDDGCSPPASGEAVGTAPQGDAPPVLTDKSDF